MVRVIRAAQAELDLEAILDFLDRRSPRAAERLALAIDQRCQVYAQFPEMGRSREELAPGLRSFTVESYLIFYRPAEEGIEVIRIVHGQRDITALFE
jgi:toxin ParE1/3/4